MKFFALSLVAFVFCLGALAEEMLPAKLDGLEILSVDVVNKISKGYNEKIRPIIDAKCLDCHSTQTKFPPYYSVPGARQLIDRDIEKARARFDFGKGFPLREKAGMIGDLRALRSEVDEGSMPLFRYVILHPEAKLKPEEKAVILQWTGESLKLLGAD